MDLENFDDFDHVPDFDEKRLFRGQEGEEWKNKELRATTRNLYLKAKEIYKLTHTLVDTFPEGNQHGEYIKGAMIGYASIIPAKIAGAASGFYSMQMEKAVIIRTAVINTLWACLTVVFGGYVEMILREVNISVTFVEWIKSFDKTNDYPDEWHYLMIR
jgi:hypothetical protein